MSSDIEPVRSGAPARGYKWKDFEENNEAALVHGGRSISHARPIAEALRPMVLDGAPWLAEPIYAGAVEEYLYDEARALLLRRYLDEVGHLNDEGEERSAARTYDRVQGRLNKHRTELGLTPRALGKILRDLNEVESATGDEEGAEAIRAEAARMLAAHLARRAATDQTDETKEGA